MGRSKTYLHCAFVLLLSWPAPLPVVHSHSDYHAYAGSWRQLVEHLVLYHPSQESRSVDPDTPHCHWLFVWAGLDAPMQAAAFDADEGATGRFASSDDSSPHLFIDTTTLSPSDAYLDRGRLRFGREDHGRADTSGLDFHRLFCVWTC